MDLPEMAVLARVLVPADDVGSDGGGGHGDV